MKILLKILSRWPLSVHYFLADYLLFPIMYYVLRYRRGLVKKNLQNAFPNSSTKEIDKLQRQFYHHFISVIVEIIYGFGLSDEEMHQHMVLSNLEQVEELTKKYGGSMLMLGHLGNWEWGASLNRQFANSKVQLCSVYRRLTNQCMDNLMSTIRGKHGGILAEKNMILRTMIRHRSADEKFAYGMISDQKPSPANAHFWTTFLSQETAFLDGSEVLARKFNYPVFYIHISQPRRGHYQANFLLMSEHPSAEPEWAITSEYVRLLEANILEQPYLWLWSHNRWKFSREK